MAEADEQVGDGAQEFPEVYVPEVQKISLDLIQINAWNPNEQTEVEFDTLVDNIRTVGFIEPLQVVPLVTGLYRVIGGAHRLQAAQVLGLKELPCVVLSDSRWDDEDLQKFVTVRLNMLRGRPNSDKMVALYREMAGKYGEKSLQRMFAYVEEDGWKKLVRQVKKTIKASGLPKGAKEKFNKEAKGIDSIDDLSAVLNRIMNEHGDTLKYGFLVFSYGGKEHVFVSMSPDTKKALDQVLAYCKEWGRDVNQVIAAATLAWVEEAEAAEQRDLEAGPG